MADGHFEFDQVAIFQAIYPSLKPHILFYSISLAIWHCLSDIRHIKGNYGRKFGNFEFDRVGILRSIYLPETAQICFIFNSLVFWHGFSDIKHNKLIMVNHFEFDQVEIIHGI